MKKIIAVLILVSLFGLTSCNQEKKDEMKKQNNTSVEKSINEFDEKLVEEIVEPLLEIK